MYLLRVGPIGREKTTTQRTRDQVVRPGAHRCLESLDSLTQDEANTVMAWAHRVRHDAMRET